MIIATTQSRGWARVCERTLKLMTVPGPQYLSAARSYARAAASSSSYAPVRSPHPKLSSVWAALTQKTLNPLPTLHVYEKQQQQRRRTHRGTLRRSNRNAPPAPPRSHKSAPRTKCPPKKFRRKQCTTPSPVRNAKSRKQSP